jgi:hypothetical protein
LIQLTHLVEKLQKLINRIENGTGTSKCVKVFTAGFTDAAKEEAASRSSSMTLSLMYTFGLVSSARHCRQAPSNCSDCRYRCGSSS